MSVVRLQFGSPKCMGSGFVAYCANGSCLVMTSYHVIEPAFTSGAMVTVIFPGGQPRFQADVQDISEAGDLAVLQFNCEGHMFEPLLFAELSTNPVLFPWAVYLHGYFNAKRGQLVKPATFPGQIDGMYVDQESGIHMLYANYTSNPGLSGGPITMGGRVIGVNKASDAGTKLSVSVLGVHTILGLVEQKQLLKCLKCLMPISSLATQALNEISVIWSACLIRCSSLRVD